jgi:hypothetical protein
MPISLTQNTLIYALPGTGRKHAWIFWNKTGQPMFDLWIKTGAAPLSLNGKKPGLEPPRMKKVEVSRMIDGHKQVISKVKPDRKTLVKLFGPVAPRMDSIIGSEDRDAFLAFVRSTKKNREIDKVLDDIGSHLWTLWEWVGEYTKDKGVGQLAKPEEIFTVKIQFYKTFRPGQWIEFIPIDIEGYTINSSNRVDERGVATNGLLYQPGKSD